jgi:endonuclease/exonuclease/phosphatase family metal-dependent hydrolase
METVVWNMQHKLESWDSLRGLGADIGLLNEATRVPDGVQALALGDTKGRDDYPRLWSTAVVSPHPFRLIEDAQATSWGRTRNVPFHNSRPGSWTAAVVSVPGTGEVTAVSLYGLLDEMSDASVHRSLSEVSPIFDDDRYRDLVVLGGDLNTSSGWDIRTDGSHLARDRTILDRISAYGLVDCLQQMRPPGRLEGCRCSFGDDCMHTRTRLDPRHPDIPYQMDYMYASPALAERLERCDVLAPADWPSPSDHFPIVATFRE